MIVIHDCKAYKSSDVNKKVLDIFGFILEEYLSLKIKIGVMENLLTVKKKQLGG